jgi:hypothetical protein
MKLIATLLLLTASTASAWAPKSSASRPLTSLQLSTTVSSNGAFVQPERVIMDELPTVYVYDHCPFCVRVRLALGIKNIKHNIHFMANDDIPTPTKLVGKKISPIFVSFTAQFIIFSIPLKTLHVTSHRRSLYIYRLSQRATL